MFLLFPRNRDNFTTVSCYNCSISCAMYLHDISCRNCYARGDVGRRAYLEAFDCRQWAALTEAARKRHTSISCLQCVAIDAFKVKLGNEHFAQRMAPAAQPRPPQQTLDLQVPKIVKRQIIQAAQKKQKTDSVEADMRALYGGKMSARGYDALTMRQVGVYKTPTPRRTTGHHDRNYSYDTATILQELLQVADESKSLGSRMNLKWSALSRRAKLASLTGAATLNRTQVCWPNAL